MWSTWSTRMKGGTPLCDLFRVCDHDLGKGVPFNSNMNAADCELK